MSKQVQKDPKSSPSPPDKRVQRQPSQQPPPPPPKEPSHDPKVVIRVEESDKSGNDKELNE
jgi:hypothetical protein